MSRAFHFTQLVTGHTSLVTSLVTSPRAARHHSFRPVHIAVTALKFGFQLHFEVRKIDQVPPRKLPNRLRRGRSTFPRLTCRARGRSRTGVWRRLVFDAGDEMNGVVVDFSSRDFRLKIKCAKRALTTSDGI